MPSNASELVAHPNIGAAELTIAWQIRGADARPTKSVEVLASGVAITPSAQVLAPDEALSACYLFMTDTSLSMKNQLKSNVIPLLTALVENKLPQHQYAIALFDINLETLASFGSDITELQAAVQSLALKGKRTELFRAALSGLGEFVQCDGYRRVLVMLSDGDAEDDPAAYTREDVGREAREQGISIYTLGFNDTIKLQILHRISEDTLGRHWRVLPGASSGVPQQLIDSSDTGGRLTIPINSLPPDTSNLQLRVTLSDDTQLETPVEFEPIVSTEPPPAPVPWWETRYFHVPAWIWLAGGAILAAFLILFILRRNPGQAEEDQLESILLDSPVATIRSGNQVFTMEKRTITIGALPENDLVINDATVSRQQATIDYRDNQFHLTDRGSTNASKVNNEVVQHHRLQTGDTLQFGDWQGVFEQLEE